jgi:hypothetical protein
LALIAIFAAPPVLGACNEPANAPPASSPTGAAPADDGGANPPATTGLAPSGGW